MKDQNQLIVKSNVNLFVWFFAFIWCCFDFVAIYLMIKDPNMLDMVSKIIIGGIVVIGTVILIPLALSKSIKKTIFNSSKKQIIHLQRYLYKKEVRVYDYKMVSMIDIEERQDVEGDTYFELFIIFDNEEKILLQEGHSKDSLLILQRSCLDLMTI